MPERKKKPVMNGPAAPVATVKQGRPSKEHVVPPPDPSPRTQRVVKSFAFEPHEDEKANGGVKPRKPHKGHSRKKVVPDTPWSVTTFQGQGIGMMPIAG